MKTKYKWLLPLLMLFLGNLSASAAEEDLFDDPFVRDEISLKNRPIYFDNETRKDLDGKVEEGSYLPKGGRLMYHYLSNRLALTGETCAINKFPTEVTVGGWTDSLQNILNDDLDDYCGIQAVAKVGLTVNPLVSVRDRSAYYAKGTTAGFCIVAGSGTSVLALDVIKAVSIGFYRDGQLVKSVPVQEGQDGSGVTLNLIQIPGTSDACINLTAEAPGVFDEIMLDYSGGLQVEVAPIIRIKYAFVGKSRMFTITKNKQNGAVSDNYKNAPDPYNPKPTPFQEYNKDNANRNADLDYMKGWNPVLLGIPFPLVSGEIDKLINEDLEDYASLTPIIAVGYQGGAKFMMKDTEDTKREIFEAGTEVGFCYDFGSALTLDVGSFLNIVLFDRNGNKVDEQNVKANVLSLGVAKGGFQNTSLVSKVPFSGAEIRFHTVLSVDLGGIFVKYAYVRDKADIRHHCPINPSMDANICPEIDEYQLRSNPAISVSWTLKEAPEGSVCSVTADGRVSGIGKKSDGTKFEKATYVFEATAADGCSDEVILTYNGFDEVECSIPMVNSKEEDAETIYTTELKREDGEISGSLITIDDLKDRDNILHQDGTYARYVGGLKLGDNVPVVGIRRTDGNLMYDATQDLNPAGRRMGFIVESAIEGLNLSVLSFYQIRCYHNGQEVYRHVVDESNTVSADIGGANQAQKVRFSILVPPIDDNGNQTKVDQIILWNSGVLEVKAGELRIYNAFWEEGDAECGIMGCSTSPLSTEETHTTLDFSRFQLGQAVSVASAVNDLDNIVDDDLESYATIFKSVDLGGVTIAVKLGRTLDYRHQLGVVTDNNSYLAAVKVADVLQVKTLYQGEDTGDVFNDWNIVDANVIGFGDKKYVVIKPTYVYDEVLLTFVGTVNALNDIRVYGLFLREDADGDGTPDCQDNAPCSDLITEMTVNQVCVGDYITVTAKGEPGEYKIGFSDSPDKAPSEEGDKVKAAADSDSKIVLQASDGRGSVQHLTTQPGMFQAVIYDKDNKPVYSVAYKVHPTYTEWLPNASNSDWTKWDNWTKGSPYCCTNVVIPSNAANYPDLDGIVTIGDEYCCNNIHFQPGAEVNSVMNLNYAKAWADLKLTPNNYHLLSAPFHSMYTGDMFIPADKKGVHDGDYFTALDAKSAEQNRFNPTIYQRMWETTAEERLWTDDSNAGYITIDMKEEIRDAISTKWSGEFNHLATPYLPGHGFSLWVDNGNLPESQEFSFRFPKEHVKYNYFIDFPSQTMLDKTTETLVRDKSGRFIYEDENTRHINFRWTEEKPGGNVEYDRDVFNGEEELVFSLEASETTGHFLFGNPFMSGIDVVKFLKGNSSEITGIITYDGNTTRKVEMDEEGNTAATIDVSFIAPMQSVFVIARENDGRKLDVTVTTDMLRRRGEADVPGEKPGEVETLRLRISDSSHEAAMLVSKGMRSEALFDNEVAPRLAIFVAEEGKAFDIVKEAGRIPLTIIKTAGASATMEFDAFGGLDRESWRLFDMEEGKEYTLDHPVALPADMGSTSGRFMLMNLNIQSNVESIGDEDNDIIINARGGMLDVKSLDAKITRVQVFDLSGATMADRRVMPTSQLSFEVGKGVCLVCVTTADGTRRTTKIMMR